MSHSLSRMKQPPVNSMSYEERIARLDEFLTRRAAVHPHRDENYDHVIEASTELADYLISGLDFEAFKPEPGKQSEAEALAERPLFICGQMKSGTGLVMTLLDGHPDLSMTPVGSHYVRTERRLNRDDFREIGRYWIQHVVSPTGKEPNWYLGRERKVLESLLLHLHYFIRHTEHDIFVCAALALYCCQERKHPARYWVEKSTQNELEAPELLRRFPKARFIHSYRDPLTNLASLKRLSDVRTRPFRARKRAQSLRKLFRAGRENQQAMGPAVYHIYRYEDLTRDTERVMREISKFLEIPFNESMLTPTENGRPATSNSMYKESRVQGRVLDQSRNQRYLKDLEPDEIADIVEEMRDLAAEFGYDWSEVPVQRPRWWHRLRPRRAGT